MKYILFPLLLIVFLAACKKDYTLQKNIENIENIENTDDENYLSDETEGDENYIQDQNQIKITRITALFAADSLPTLNLYTGKKQKFAKRQIINTNSTTVFKIQGTGFKIQSDTSKVIAIIKTDTIGNCTIDTWSDSLIVCRVPQLTIETHIQKEFSLKFRIICSNDIAGKKPLSKTKSRAAISRTQTEIMKNAIPCASISAYIYIKNYRKITTTLPECSPVHKQFFNSSASAIGENPYIPTIGDIVFEQPSENYTTFGTAISGLVVGSYPNGDISIRIYAKPLCTEPSLFPEIEKIVRYKKVPISGRYNDKLVPVGETEHQITSNPLATYLR